MATYRRFEEHNSFESELRDAFGVARDQLNQEEVRIINFYRNLPRRAYHRSSRKEAMIEQLTEIHNDIEYKLVSPQLDSIKSEAMKLFGDVIRQTREKPDVSLTEGEVDSIVDTQLEEFELELKKSRDTINSIMHGRFLSDQSNSILQKMHGLKHKLVQCVREQPSRGTPPLLLVPDGSHSYHSEANPYITEAKRSKTEPSSQRASQVCPMQPEGMQLKPEQRQVLSEYTPYPEQTTRTSDQSTRDPHESLLLIETPLPKPELELEQITTTAEPIDYKSKARPIRTAGTAGQGVGMFKLPKGIAYDPNDAKIFITESSSAGSGVQVFSIGDNKFTTMKQTILKKPHGIAVKDEHLYVTDIELHCVVQFTTDLYEFVARAGEKGSGNGQLNTPSGLCVDNNYNVYIADNKNNRVCVFTKSLCFKENIGVGQLTEPKDVKLTKETVAVLDTGGQCLHFFSRRTGEITRSCIAMGKGRDVLRPMSLFLDAHLNILISDQFGHSVRIFDQRGQLIHSIGEQGTGEGQLFSPTGLFVSKRGELVVVSSNKNHILQFF